MTHLMKNLNNKDGNAIADVGIWKISWLFTNYKWYCLEGFIRASVAGVRSKGVLQDHAEGI